MYLLSHLQTIYSWQLTYVSLDCRRNQEYPGRTHSNTRRTCKLHTEGFHQKDPQNLLAVKQQWQQVIQKQYIKKYKIRSNSNTTSLRLGHSEAELTTKKFNPALYGFWRLGVFNVFQSLIQEHITCWRIGLAYHL